MNDVRANPFRLAIVSCLTLFTELAVIRWISTEVRIFAYAKNLALLLCFLGFGVGCALAAKRLRWRLSLEAMLGLILIVRNPWTPKMFEGLSQTLGAGQDTQIWFVATAQSWPRFLLATLIAGVLFFLVSTIFVPFGQVVSQEMDLSRDRLRAYTWNLGASLLGIGMFFLVSSLALPPMIWFAVVLAGFAGLQKGWKSKLAVAALIVPAVWLLHDRATADHFSFWTPYQQIEVQKKYFPDGEAKEAEIRVNHVGYQLMVNLSAEFLAKHPGLVKQPVDELPYNVPFRFAVPHPSVLIVGAGSGNDAAGALRGGSRAVDAVEIDPAILKFGSTHPERPYASPIVTAHLNDARAFMKRADKKYDLVLFGLLDSHTQPSEYANMRIDNFVYTEQSIREARNLLSPDGVLLVKFQVNREWLGRRLYGLLSEVFGKPPTVFLADSSYGAGATCFAISTSSQVENRLRQDAALAEFVKKNTPAFVSQPAVALTSDDWPYLYQKTKSIPIVFLTLSALVIGLAWFYRRSIAEIRADRPALFYFAMGAGFVLLETQTISRLALFFGTTWQVNGIAIAAILTALMLANMVVEKQGGTFGGGWLFGGLLASLLVIYLVPFGRIPAATSTVGAIAAGLFAVPVFFAGLIFASRFRSVANPGAALAANMLGAVVGGLMENLSLIVGLNALLLIAAMFYLAAWWAGNTAADTLPETVGSASSAA